MMQRGRGRPAGRRAGNSNTTTQQPRSWAGPIVTFFFFSFSSIGVFVSLVHAAGFILWCQLRPRISFLSPIRP
ncbi:hypothetical protein BJX76DRAFT_153282 [Aspergillus varians]